MAIAVKPLPGRER